MFSLIRCGTDGSPIEPIGTLPDEIAANCKATAEFYGRIGFIEPWVGYVAVDSDTAVGGGAFVGAPRDNLVEIAYYTLSRMEGKGYATQTASELLRIARTHQPGITIKAFTLRENNASTKILEKLGFKLFGDARDPYAGDVWEWRA